MEARGSGPNGVHIDWAADSTLAGDGLAVDYCDNLSVDGFAENISGTEFTRAQGSTFTVYTNSTGRARVESSGNIALGTSAGSYGGGTGVVFLAGSAAAAPTANPTGGVLLYMDSATGRLKLRQPDGTNKFVALSDT